MSSTGSWTRPTNTDIILYEYLWRAERERGLDTGRKVRPCLVVATYEHKGLFRVITAPLTTRDYDPANVVAIPPPVRRHLGLDDRTKVVWSDLNNFAWVGEDVRPTADGTPYLGRMPERIWRAVVDRVVAARIAPVIRD